METIEGRYEKAIKELGQAVSQLTWLGHFWGISGAIVLDEIRSRCIRHLEGDATSTLSARSSTYYAAAGNARARAAKAFFTKPLWFLIAFLCFMRSVKLSNRFQKAVGIINMSANELDVRSHILRRVDRHYMALACVVHALSKPDLSPNARALLLMGKAESLAEFGSFAEAVIAYHDALALKDHVPVSTHVRLLRSIAEFRRKSGNKKKAQEFLRQARVLAVQSALGDQVKKIEAAQ